MFSISGCNFSAPPAGRRHILFATLASPSMAALTAGFWPFICPDSGPKYAAQRTSRPPCLWKKVLFWTIVNPQKPNQSSIVNLQSSILRIPDPQLTIINPNVPLPNPQSAIVNHQSLQSDTQFVALMDGVVHGTWPDGIAYDVDLITQVFQ